LGERGPDVLGHAVVHEAQELADLHEGALHLPERGGDVLGAVELEVDVEPRSALSIST
jgi:hypothetical protein